jgi:hypothetical protein
MPDWIVRLKTDFHDQWELNNGIHLLMYSVMTAYGLPV